MKVFNRTFDSNRAYKLSGIVINSVTIVLLLLLTTNVIVFVTDEPGRVYRKCYDTCNSVYSKLASPSAYLEDWQIRGWGDCSSGCMERDRMFRSNNGKNIEKFGLIGIGLPLIFYGGIYLINYLFHNKGIGEKDN